MGLSRRAKDLIAIFFIFAFTLFYFRHFILSGQEKVLSSPRTDLANSGFYYSQLGFSLLKKGEPPLWNPYVFSGVPLLAGLQAAFFYPLRWFSLFMEEGRALNLSFIFHFFLGPFFLYLLLRYYNLSPFSSALAGLIFFYGAGPLLHLYAGHDCDIWTMVWIPLVILFLDLCIHRSSFKYPLWGGIFLGLQILACHPQQVYYTFLAGIWYLLFHLNWKVRVEGRDNLYLLSRIIIFLAVALGVSAIQLLPSLEMVRNSYRLAGTTLAWVGQNSLPPENFLTMLIPGFLGDMVSSPYLGRWYLWENCLYLGTGAILFGSMAFLGPKNRKIYFSLTLAAGALFLAMGKYNPLFPCMFRFFPGFSFFRGQAKFIYLYSFGLSILAGYGLEYLFARPAPPDNSRLRKFILSWSLIGLFLLALILSAPDRFYPFWQKILAAGFREGERYGLKPSDFTAAEFKAAYMTMLQNARLTLIWLTLTLLGIYGWLKKWRYAPGLIALIIAADLFVFGQKYLVSFNLQHSLKEDGVVNFLKRDPSLFRIGEIEPVPLNRHIYHRFFSVGGYAGNILSRYNLFINLSQGLPLDSMNLALYLKTHSPLMNSLNLKYILSPSFKRINLPDFNLVYEDGQRSIYENKGFLPRVYLVPEVIRREREEDVLKKLISVDFNFLRQAVVEAGKEESFPGPWPGNFPGSFKNKIAITRYEPNEVEIELWSEQRSFLVLADAYYPGWKAYVNGRRQKIFPANYIFRGLTVEAGNSRIIFRYEPWSYKIGCGLTLATLALLVGALLICKFCEVNS